MNTSFPANTRQLKVSVLLITYNHEKYISQAIESALAQTVNFDYEIVAGDDFSTDKTREIVVKFQRRYPDKIRLLLPAQNLGLGGNKLFIEIFQSCRGQYVAFLDGDDYWTCSDKLQRQADFLDQHPECSMGFHNVMMYYEGEDRDPHPFDLGSQKEISGVEDLLRGNFIQKCSAMIRRDAMTVFPEWLYAIEPQDWAIYLLTALQGKVGYLKDVMGAYRRHRGGMFYGLDEIQHLRKAVLFYETILGKLGSSDNEIIKREMAMRLFNLAMRYERRGDLEGAATSLRKCLDVPIRSPEEFSFGKGVNREEARKMLWLCLHQGLHQMLTLVKPTEGPLMWWATKTRTIMWWATKMEIGSRMLWRFVTRGSIGLIKAVPNPVPAVDLSGSGVTRLMWRCKGVANIELRIGAPDGRLFYESGPKGSAPTGNWVRDEMKFFLQDVSGGRNLCRANTLDAVRVRVKTEEEN